MECLGVSGMECEPVAFWLPGTAGGVCCEASQHAGNIHSAMLGKGKGSGSPSSSHFMNKIKQTKQRAILKQPVLLKSRLGLDF